MSVSFPPLCGKKALALKELLMYHTSHLTISNTLRLLSISMADMPPMQVPAPPLSPSPYITNLASALTTALPPVTSKQLKTDCSHTSPVGRFATPILAAAARTVPRLAFAKANN